MRRFDDDFYYGVESREKKNKQRERRNRVRDKDKKRNEFINEWNKLKEDESVTL